MQEMEKLYDEHETVAARVPAHVKCTVEAAARKSGSRSLSAYICETMWATSLRILTEGGALGPENTLE